MSTLSAVLRYIRHPPAHSKDSLLHEIKYAYKGALAGETTFHVACLRPDYSMFPANIPAEVLLRFYTAVYRRME